MRKGINITYALRTNAMQYAFLNHEMEKTYRMYEILWKQKQRCQQYFDVKQHIKGYAKHYLPTISCLEMRYMGFDLSRDCSSYQCRGVVDKRLIWRGVHLYPMMIMPYYWMREPIYYHFRILESQLYHKHHVFYLTLLFDKQEKNML